MYIRTGDGFGQSTITRSGHTRDAWSKCESEGPRQRMCNFYLNLKFRPAYADFRNDVERAFRRWMTGPRARLLAQKNEPRLKAIHKEMLDKKFPLNSPVNIWGQFVYRGPDGPRQEWRVVDATILDWLDPAFKPPPASPPSPPAPDQCRMEGGFLVCKKPCVPRFSRGGFNYELAPGAADPSRPDECWYIRILAAG